MICPCMCDLPPFFHNHRRPHHEKDQGMEMKRHQSIAKSAVWRNSPVKVEHQRKHRRWHFNERMLHVFPSSTRSHATSDKQWSTFSDSDNALGKKGSPCFQDVRVVWGIGWEYCMKEIRRMPMICGRMEEDHTCKGKSCFNPYIPHLGGGRFWYV